MDERRILVAGATLAAVGVASLALSLGGGNQTSAVPLAADSTALSIATTTLTLPSTTLTLPSTTLTLPSTQAPTQTTETLSPTTESRPPTTETLPPTTPACRQASFFVTTERVDLTGLVEVGGPVCQALGIQSPRLDEWVILVASVEKPAAICELFGRRDGFTVWRIEFGESDPVEVTC